MRALRRGLAKAAPWFAEGAPLARLHPAFEAIDTLLFTPADVTRTASHVRDGINLKRIMTIVVIALLPCIVMAMYNTGYQAQFAIAQGAQPLDDWRYALVLRLGGGTDPTDTLGCVLHGALYFFPMLIVVFATGLGIEILFAIVRRHEVNEGFFVTGTLIPLIVPPAIPLWQVALGTAFGVVFAKEIFGGTGMNFLNPALVTRAFLFFAYPSEISGDAPWIAADFAGVDGFTGATLLARAAATPGVTETADWMQAFVGRVPGSMGETSTVACLAGATLLLLTRMASWRIMVAVTAGTLVAALGFNAIGSTSNPLFAVPFHWHLVMGGWAFGTVFMATDPVTATATDAGKWLYGAGIGILAVLIRVVNPAYPEGMMLAILLMNVFAPLIDHAVVARNVARRERRYAT